MRAVFGGLLVKIDRAQEAPQRLLHRTKLILCSAVRCVDPLDNEFDRVRRYGQVIAPSLDVSKSHTTVMWTFEAPRDLGVQRSSCRPVVEYQPSSTLGIFTLSDQGLGFCPILLHSTDRSTSYDTDT